MGHRHRPGGDSHLLGRPLPGGDGCWALPVTTGENTWQAFCAAVQRWGLPSGHLSDNGLNFSGRLRGYEVSFETNLRAAGVRPITSRPFHPQTCGKVERFHQTLKRWLRRQPLARSLVELQAQLERFVAYYNAERPHRGIGRVTPLERWSATPKTVTSGVVLPGPERTTTAPVDRRGLVWVCPWAIHIGVDHAGRTAKVMLSETHAAVFVDDQLVRHLELDHSKHYQASRRPQPGRRRLP